MAQDKPTLTPNDSPSNHFPADEQAERNLDMPPVEPLVTEICLSPLLWSDSVGVFLDG